ncbi:tyrosine-protein phosphatase non-receptor type 5 [Oncorhynchus kisutch]|uniref:protein-tyrosine-phosphatase n=1 Tax=Oncorhynchus kisutch TaxID=8019 RepID=A0A8C7JAT1_ONCKI|nr:tyrosine-protein phosphatase non-receptor type 5 [Oncorhynchus kisutch]
MTRRLSSSTRSQTEDSVFLKPDEDPIWLDDPPTTDGDPSQPGDGPPGLDEPPGPGTGPPGPQRHPEELWRDKFYTIVMGMHWCAVFCTISQITGYWVFFLVDGNGLFSAFYKSLQLLDFYLGVLLSFNPVFGVDSLCVMAEVEKTNHYWVLQATEGIGMAIIVFMIIRTVCKLEYGDAWWSAAKVADHGDRRQSVSRQPSFTLSEWTDAQEDLMDLEAEPQTPIFDLGLDTRTEGDITTLSVTPVGLQERRGSNVSLTLDMCSPGCTEPYGYGAQLSPRDQTAKEYLREGTNTLTPSQLHTRAIDDQALQAEFYETPMNFVDPKEYNYPGLVRKNRYKTILPNAHSRVILRTADEEEFLSTYINANYLQGYGGEERAYIATQGPTVNTVGDFWRMVWQERCPIIVMITNLEEKNEKCAEYWPEDSVTHEGIEIKVVTVTQEDDYSLRVFTLKFDGEERSLRQYWYTSWPDQKTPDKAPPLLELVEEVEQARAEAPPTSGPVIVHCSAGIGRTGCFIATSILCKQLRSEGVVDILKTTCQLRLDRGGMIQTGEQYQFVHHVLSLYEKQLSHIVEE